MIVTINEITRNDIPTINRWRHDREIIDYLGAPFRFINVETDENWFESYMKNRHVQVRCGIYLGSESKLVGVVYLTDIDVLNRNAELSILLGDKTKLNKGIGSIAVKHMLRHAFGDLNLERVYLRVLEKNRRAIAFYKKVGFVLEGTLRKVIYKNSKYHNMLMMSILRNEYRNDYCKGV
jgi:RimJ/RimL family protein N-acetyltransferase